MPMNYRDYDDWRLPARTLLRAIRLGFTYPLPHQAHRALRLFVIAGLAAAGSCLAIGFLVLVATAAAPGKALPHLAASAQRTALALSHQRHGTHSRETATGSQPGPAESAPAAGATAATGPTSPAPVTRAPGATPSARITKAARMAGSGQVLATFAGSGNMITPDFKVRAGVRWELRYSYTCPAGAQAGQLIVAEGSGASVSPPAVGPNINASGISGDGSTWLSPDGANHYLMVISTCSWTMEVVQSR